MSRPRKTRAEAALDAYLALEPQERRIYKELLAYMEKKGLVCVEGSLEDAARSKAPTPRRKRTQPATEPEKGG